MVYSSACILLPDEHAALGIRRARQGMYGEALCCFRSARQAHLAAVNNPLSLPPDSALAFAMGTHARLGSSALKTLPAELVYRVVVACGGAGHGN